MVEITDVKDLIVHSETELQEQDKDDKRGLDRSRT